jgi:Domain of unknown function (DUF1929)
VNELRSPSLTPELYDAETKTWRLLSNATSSLYTSAWYYPRVFLASANTLVLFPRDTNEVWTLQTSGQGALNRVGNVPGPPFLHTTPATYIDRYKVLIIQGGQQASIVDIRNPVRPVSVPTGSLREPRIWANAVNLPNGEVLMVGGASVEESLPRAVRYAEIWNPITGRWRVAATADKSRLYHSAALLLPDATVLVGGGGPPGPEINMNAEIYEPPYLFAADGSRAIRPVIATMAEPGYGQTIAVTMSAATRIVRVSLIRLGSVTHSFNMEERALTMPFTQPQPMSLTVRFSGNRTITPPGWYMLFLVNAAGVPSVAEIVSLL